MVDDGEGEAAPIRARVGSRLRRAEDVARAQRAQLEVFGRFPALAGPSGAAVHDCEAQFTGDDGSVVLLFSHDDFPGVRFGYRCKAPGEDRYEGVWLGEEIATGALHRMMRYDHPIPSAEGVVWTRLHGQLLGVDDDSAESALVLRTFAHVAASLDGASCGILVPGEPQPLACQEQAVARVGAGVFDRAVLDETMSPLRTWSGLFVGACHQHLQELQRRAELRDAEVEFIDPGR